VPRELPCRCSALLALTESARRMPLRGTGLEQDQEALAKYGIRKRSKIQATKKLAGQ
jgi:hypothetical protein